MGKIYPLIKETKKKRRQQFGAKIKLENNLIHKMFVSSSLVYTHCQTYFSYTTLNVRRLKIEQLSRDPAFEA